MEVVWSSHREVTVREIADALPEYAYTTVATVLDRLVVKEVLVSRTVERAKRYMAIGSSGAHTAALMHEALSSGSDPEAALRRFAESLDRAEVAVLRDALRDPVPRPG